MLDERRTPGNPQSLKTQQPTLKHPIVALVSNARLATVKLGYVRSQILHGRSSRQSPEKSKGDLGSRESQHLQWYWAFRFAFTPNAH